MRPDELPDNLLDHQYTRCALYLSHMSFVEHAVGRGRGVDVSAIEFGGSNGFVAGLFEGCDYQIAPNAPEVDVQDLGRYPSDSYDFVVLDEILEHVERPWLAIDEVRRILKPGGCLIISTPFMIAEHRMPRDYWRFTKDGLRVLLRDFSVVEAHSWGNAASVRYLTNGMMVSTREAIDAGAFDLDDVERFAVSVWAYAWK